MTNTLTAEQSANVRSVSAAVSSHIQYRGIDVDEDGVSIHVSSTQQWVVDAMLALLQRAHEVTCRVKIVAPGADPVLIRDIEKQES